MEGIPRIPRIEEIEAAYETGKAAVVALIVEQAAEWVSAFQKQQETIAILEERVQALEDQLAKNSPEQQQAAFE